VRIVRDNRDYGAGRVVKQFDERQSPPESPASIATFAATRIASSVVAGPEAEIPRRLSSPLSRRPSDD
jgi:hypothetical protein